MLNTFKLSFPFTLSDSSKVIEAPVPESAKNIACPGSNTLVALPIVPTPPEILMVEYVP